MHGGSIIENRTLSGGSVHVGVTSTFNMYSGTIAHNSATGGDAGGGGGAGVGAGVRLDSTTATFNMRGGEIRDNTTLASNGHGGGVAVASGATFNMHAGVISGNNASSATSQGGGIVVLNDSTFNLYGGTIEGNSAEQGGGVVISAEGGQPSSTFTMHAGAVITDNTSRTFSGGGVMIHAGSTFTMHGGEISLNVNGAATARGGGVAVDGSSTFIMNSGTVMGNTGGVSGGGVFINAGSTFNMSGGSVVRDNTATYGGGIFIANGATLSITGGSRITGNTAVNNGGGIGAENYGNITIDATTIFAGNRASSRHDLSLHEDYPGIVTAIPAADNGLPGGVVGNASNVAWYSVSIPLAHALNNYDVNFIGRQIREFIVVFHGEGGTILPGDEARPVLEGRSLAQMLAIAGPAAGMPPNPTRTMYTFGGWNRVAAGTGDWFVDSTLVTADMVTLNPDTLIYELHVYAQWSPIYVVIFHGSGGVVHPQNQRRYVAQGHSLSQMTPGMPPNPTREGYDFVDWIIQRPTRRFFSNTIVTSAMVNEHRELHVFARWTRPREAPQPRPSSPPGITTPGVTTPGVTAPPEAIYNPPTGSAEAGGNVSLLIIAMLSTSAAPLALLANKKYGKKSAEKKNKS